MIPDHDFVDYRNRRVLVMGLGSFGGGIGAVKFLVERGAIVTVTDLRPIEKMKESLELLKDTPPARIVAGGHDKNDFLTTELVVANPAVKRDCQYLNTAINAGIPTTSEMNLFWKWNRAPIVAVTGSNGKSTTTAMIHAILSQFALTKADQRIWLGGNIGASLLPIVDQIRSHDLVVLELSSFQLADLDRMQVSPHVAVVTNFAPNHLDWHPDLDHYRHSKQAILRWQQPTDFAVLNEDDADVTAWPVNGIRLGFGLDSTTRLGAFAGEREAIIHTEGDTQRWPLDEWLNLPGRHNFANALAAIAASIPFGGDATAIESAIQNYKPLPHRLQFVGEWAGRKFYNDSLATTPESAEVALQAFDQPIILLAGGYDKQVDLSHMARAIALRAKAVALMGQTAVNLRDKIEGQDHHCEVSPLKSDFAASFAWAVEQSQAGDIVLLSPGCASYDWFKNFADRGQQFSDLVHEQMARPIPM